MSESKDTLFRYLALLQLIPPAPRFISTPVLLEKLEERGFFVDVRSLQRDLKDKLSRFFPIVCHDREKPFRWSFDSEAHPPLYAMDTPALLAFHLAEHHLGHLLPPTVMALLEPQFRAARRQLQGLAQNGLAQWPARVRALPNGKALLPAEVDPVVWDTVATALVEQRQLRVDYLSRSKGEAGTLRIHPAGLVARHSVSYLIGTANDYDDLRQFALHRLLRVELLEEKARDTDSGELDRYIAGGAFSSRRADAAVELVADVHPQVAWLLNETPLSRQQKLEPLPDTDWQRLRATVPLDQETLWWIFGLNDRVRVHAPAVWVAEIRERLDNLRRLYAV